MSNKEKITEGEVSVILIMVAAVALAISPVIYYIFSIDVYQNAVYFVTYMTGMIINITATVAMFGYYLIKGITYIINKVNGF